MDDHARTVRGVTDRVTADPAPIVVIEDDPGIGPTLARTLAAQGYPTVLAATAAEADALIGPTTPLVILDLGLPDADGLDLCRALRARFDDLQILILTARTDEANIVLGLDAGAEDYLTKPFRLSELLARVRVCMRRRTSHQTARSCGPIRVDSATRVVTRSGEPVVLRPKEFDLLWKLVSNSHRVVPRDELINDVWDEHFFGSTKTLDIHIWALRQKLDDPAEPSRIATVRGIGYRMVET
jgi:DNA-binding response OmpR family regulator